MDDLRLTPMTDFTTDPPGDLLGRATFAVFNRERSHRYWLIRIWDRARPLLVVVMFNPSDADDERNDPTISALIHFATMWGYGGLLVINLHSHVSSQPSAIRRLQADDVETCPYPNVVAWKEAIGYARDQHLPILLAWGNLGDEPTIKRSPASRTTSRQSASARRATGGPSIPWLGAFTGSRATSSRCRSIGASMTTHSELDARDKRPGRPRRRARDAGRSPLREDSPSRREALERCRRRTTGSSRKRAIRSRST
jgi:hypothetical protein